MFTIAYVHTQMHISLCASTDLHTMRLRRSTFHGLALTNAPRPYALAPDINAGMAAPMRPRGRSVKSRSIFSKTPNMRQVLAAIDVAVHTVAGGEAGAAGRAPPRRGARGVMQTLNPKPETPFKFA